MKHPPFSVLLCVYKEDSPDYLRQALESVINQTASPDEIVIVEDGPLTDSLRATISEFQREYEELTTVSLSVNQGLGAALETGVRTCTYDLVARMDSDDISVHDRFEQQLNHISSNPDVDVVGGYIGEFRDNPQNVVQVRKVPTDADELESFSRFRCPTNHPTVMFRRESVLAAGNYRPLRSQQDYDLWMRMLSEGYTIENIPTVLVRARADDGLYHRRGGLDYARLEYSLQRDFVQLGAITRGEFVRNLLFRIPVRLVPSQIRERVYRHLLRE